MDLIGVFLHILFWYGAPLLVLGLVVLLIMDGAKRIPRKVDSSRPDHWGPTVAGAGIGTLIALGAGSFPLFDDGSLSSDWLRGVAFIAILILPAILAVIGLRRPKALLTAGVVSLPMPFMSFSFLLFPMLIPAALYLVAYGRAAMRYTPRAPASVAAVITFLLLVFSFFALFLHDDPQCYEIVKRRDGSTFERLLPADDMSRVISLDGRVIESGCTSDTVTPTEVGLSLALVALAGTSAAYLSGPRRSSQASLDVHA